MCLQGQMFNLGSVRYVCVLSVIKRRSDPWSRWMVYDIPCRTPEPVFRFEMVVLSVFLLQIVFRSHTALLKTIKLKPGLCFYGSDPTPSSSIGSSSPRERVALALSFYGFRKFLPDSLLFVQSHSKLWQPRWSRCFGRWSSMILNNKCSYSKWQKHFWRWSVRPLNQSKYVEKFFSTHHLCCFFDWMTFWANQSQSSTFTSRCADTTCSQGLLFLEMHVRLQCSVHVGIYVDSVATVLQGKISMNQAWLFSRQIYHNPPQPPPLSAPL